MAIEDLVATFGKRYPRGAQYLKQLETLDRQKQEVEAAVEQKDRRASTRSCRRSSRPIAVCSKRRCSPTRLIDFDRLLLVKRGQARLGLPQNWQGNCALPKTGYDNEIMVLSPVRPDGKLTTLYKPEGTEFVGDLNLNFDADKLLFSMPKVPGRWQIWEIKTDGSGLRQVTPGEEPDVDNYNACYLPNGRILFDSTRCFQGVPCVGGGNTVANLCLMDGRRQPHAADLFRPGPRLVPVAVERRPRALHALGIHRHRPLLHPAAVPHESGRHGPGRVLQEQLAVAEFDLLCQGHPGPSDQGRGRHLRPSRRAADGRIGDLRSGQGTAPGRRRRAAHSRLRRQGGAGHRRSDRQQVLAQVPAPAAAEREVLPRGHEARSVLAVGHLPGRYLRQPDAHQGAARTTSSSSRCRCERRPARRSFPTA